MVEGTRLFEGLRILEHRGEIPMQVEGLVCDSRHVKPNDLFVALRGETTDGHRYLDDVCARGACAVVVEEFHDGLALPQLRVDDTLAILPELASRFYDHPANHLHMIGVTGSNGKTTSTYLLEQLWQSLGQPMGVVGTIEYRYGSFRQEAANTTPLPHDMQATLRRMVDAGCERVAMEVSSHGLVLHRVDGLSFDVALFTNLTQDHLDFHKTMDAYRDAKGLLFSRYLKAGGIAVLNVDDEAGRYYAETNPSIQQIHYGIENEAHVTAQIESMALEGCRFSLNIGETSLPSIHTTLVGKHNIYNILGVVGVAHACRISPHQIEEAIRSFQAVPGRLETVPTSIGAQVVVDYSHTPDALEQCLKALRQIEHKRIITVFGCGGDRDRTKRPLMGEIALRLSDHVFVTSDNPRTEDPKRILDDIHQGMRHSSHFTTIADRYQAIGAAIDDLHRGDILLIAGKGHETYQLVGHTKHDFDDRRVAREHLQRTGKGDGNAA